MRRIVIICPYCGNTQNQNRTPYCSLCNKEFNVKVIVSKMEVQEYNHHHSYSKFDSQRYYFKRKVDFVLKQYPQASEQHLLKCLTILIGGNEDDHN